VVHTHRKRKREEDGASTDRAHHHQEGPQYDLLIIGAGASGVGCGAMAKTFRSQMPPLIVYSTRSRYMYK
jgi:hypothetical protein